MAGDSFLLYSATACMPFISTPHWQCVQYRALTHDGLMLGLLNCWTTGATNAEVCWDIHSCMLKQEWLSESTMPETDDACSSPE